MGGKEMSDHLIDVGDNLRDELRWLVKFKTYHPSLFKDGDIVSLDLSKVSFTIPYCLLSLLAYCKAIYRRTKNKVILCGVPIDPMIFQYLERVNFFILASKYCEIQGDFSEVPLWGRDALSKKLHGIVEISKDAIAGASSIAIAIESIKQRYDDILGFFAAKHSNADLFFTILSELTANIPEHSKSSGYLHVQKYESQRKQEVFTSVSIMDTGIGIKKRLREQPRRRKSIKNYTRDYEFLQYAFSEKGTRSGAGLNSVMRAIQGWDPADIAMLAISGRGLMYKGKGDGEFTFEDKEKAFKGTHITLWFYGKLNT